MYILAEDVLGNMWRVEECGIMNCGNLGKFGYMGFTWFSFSFWRSTLILFADFSLGEL